MDNLYRVLEILPTASQEEVREAYARRRANLLAQNAQEPGLALQLADLDSAFVTLGDPDQRANYDRSLKGADPGGQTSIMKLDEPTAILRPDIVTPLVQQPCPYCSAPNPIQATICVQCQRQIARPCPNCGHSVQLGQPVCPRCNTYLKEYDERRMMQSAIVEDKTKMERLEGETSVQALEAGHRVRAAYGVVFWAIVALACVVLTVGPILLYVFILNQQ